ncbi:mechanosensitive ion channel protein [Bordetella trematum]|uniref:Mechanosensitive protein n=1 Tax=Bordetella trematum TaxID=123899 RepID=A0A157Q5Z4_9BORD|nr:DUF3772 domain-containing protein [Bordetella trematum]AZR94876.1 mechanosensitive ion channel protein [Bordetella trematum]NNH19973.1 mechanosensitive ion channel family protein [Bordetella trematum]SAI41177.1 mechanosensitive protein [Bordetella trematum]SAI65968.1 mechanosensitive protein [Bordetella trematum]SUV96841.1 mechanosensitive protein [Bordetella trematum]
MTPLTQGWRVFLPLLMLWLALLPAPASAQPPADEAEAILSEARRQLDGLRKSLPELENDDILVKRRSEALEIQAQANAAATTLTPELAGVSARLAELGQAPEGQSEAGDVARQRAQLERDSRNLDSQLKLARLLAVEAQQTAEQISAMRREQFQASLGERRGSVLSAAFWRELKTEAPQDQQRLNDMLDKVAELINVTPGRVWAMLVALVALVLALRYWVSRKILQLTATRVPPGRLRRSLLAVTLVALSSLTPPLIAALFASGLTWEGEAAADTRALLTDLIEIAAVGGFVAGLGHALLSQRRPSWRLLPLPDDFVAGLRWLPLTLGVLVVATWAAERLPGLINASLIGTIALSNLVAALMAIVMMIALGRAERLRRRANEAPARPLWLVALETLAWLSLVASLLALLSGYSALGSFLVRQTLWSVVVLASAYLVAVLVDDGFSTLLRVAPGAESQALHARLRSQTAVLLSGLGRMMIILIAVVLLAEPFGEAPVDLMQRLSRLYEGLQIGEINIRPGAVAQALLVLAVALLVVRLVKHWLAQRYLPTTELDPGMQTSAATLFGYAGAVLAVSLALSALGIGLERVAWIASALSVGIGFGLQAVVQNFVSGLILLAERPVKVGDWVSLGGIEGDIQRINVRATEIQMSDRSTVIVPNSEFITKTVRNVTHANPMGVVQIKLPMPLSSNAEQVRQIMLQAFVDQADILDTPEPQVYLDGIENSQLVFNARGYVSSPRNAYGVRSALLFTILKALSDADVAMAASNTLVLRNLPEPASTPAASS